MSIKTAFQKLGTKIAMTTKANYPKWMVIGGTILVVGAGVGACVVTHKKLKPVLDEHKENVAKIKEEYEIKKEEIESEEVTEENDDAREEMEVTEEEKAEKKEQYKEGYQKKIFWAYMSTAGKLVKMYAVPATCTIGGLMLIFKGHMTTEARYIGAAAEGYAINEAFSKYRDRVAQRFGKAVEEEIFTNGEHKLITEEVTDKDTGETKNVTKDTLVADPKGDLGVYSFIFDECNCPHSWAKHPGYNFSYLVNMQNQANDYLMAHGAITLYEVLKQLGFQDIDPDTMNKGWMVNNPCCTDDKKQSVDFGICNCTGNYEDVGCFTGGTPDYILNFNVQGDIQAAMKIKRAKDKERREKTKRAAAESKIHAVIKEIKK
jgi:hypothetical protein